MSGFARMRAPIAYQLVPAGLVGDGKSTYARLQSTTVEGLIALVAAPLMVIRKSVEGNNGRFTPLNVRLASDEITLT